MALLRDLDAIAITDHNMVAPSLYAQEVAKKNKVSLQVITGAEISIWYLEEEVHILALGVKEQPDFWMGMPVDSLIREIHDKGGIAVLSHPHVYHKRVFDTLKHQVDAVEYYNGGVAFHNNASGFYNPLKWDENKDIRRTGGSDYHFPSPALRQQWYGYKLEDEWIINKLGLTVPKRDADESPTVTDALRTRRSP
jgi:predicted metal-dependent phosphoesterase TrpH